MANGAVLCAFHDGLVALKFVGEVRLADSFRASAALDGYLDEVFQSGEVTGALVDMTETQSIDSTNLGLIARLGQFSLDKFGHYAVIVVTSPDIVEILESVRFDTAFTIVTHPEDPELDLQPLAKEDTVEYDYSHTVMKAHNALIKLDARNEPLFRNVIEAFEQRLETDQF